MGAPVGTRFERTTGLAKAVEVVVREGRGSVSLLQRALGIGYGRSARLIDFMAEDGIVGTYNGAQARDVLITPEQWAQMRGGAEEAEEAEA
jgi:S-DNA-T family DNA segregation ATPase FtsK/SpoIIIE